MCRNAHCACGFVRLVHARGTSARGASTGAKHTWPPLRRRGPRCCSACPFASVSGADKSAAWRIRRHASGSCALTRTPASLSGACTVRVATRKSAALCTEGGRMFSSSAHGVSAPTCVVATLGRAGCLVRVRLGACTAPASLTCAVRKALREHALRSRITAECRCCVAGYWLAESFERRSCTADGRSAGGDAVAARHRCPYQRR